MNRWWWMVSVSLAFPVLLAAGHAGPRGQSANPELEVVRRWSYPVLTTHTPGAEGNKYGFEGGRVVKLGTTYHLFTSEMIGDPHWVKMRLAHWASGDRLHWRRVGTLFESSGDFSGKDPRAALWSPIPVYDAAGGRWNLFYVAYQAAPDTRQAWLTNHRGRIWRAVSTVPGRDGINGPYKDEGVILEPGPDSDSWEGLQGTDSFFPYRVGSHWYAIYGSAHTETLPLSLWQVGLAWAEELGGPWTRCTPLNPMRVEPRFIENPIVTRVTGGNYIAVYDNHQPEAIGYAISGDGLHWPTGRPLVVQTGDGIWASEVRTPLGLIPEGNGLYTLFYTANEKARGGRRDRYGVTLTPGAVGLVEVRIRGGRIREGRPAGAGREEESAGPDAVCRQSGHSGGSSVLQQGRATIVSLGENE